MELDTERANRQPKCGHRRVTFTDEQLKEMAERYAAGDSLLDLSVDFGLADKAIAQRLREMGVTIRPRTRRGRKNKPRIYDR